MPITVHADAHSWQPSKTGIIQFDPRAHADHVIVLAIAVGQFPKLEAPFHIGSRFQHAFVEGDEMNTDDAVVGGKRHIRFLVDYRLLNRM